MSSRNSLVGFVVGALILGITWTASARSLYVIGDLNTNPTPIRAYDINPTTGLLTFQTQHTVPWYSGGGVDVAMDSDNGYLFVVYEFSTTINIIYGKNMKQVGTVNMPNNTHTAGIVYDHTRKRLYAANRARGRVYSYSWNHVTKKLTYIGYYALSGLSKTYGLDLDEAKGLLYVGGRTSKVYIYDVTNKFAQKGSISMKYPAVGVAVDAFRRRLYAGTESEYTNSGQPYLCQYNLDTRTLIKCVSGYKVRGLSVDAGSGFIYVTTYTNKALVVYDNNLNMKQNLNSIGNPTGLIVPGKDVSYNPLNLTKSDGLDDNKDCVNPGSTYSYTISYENKNSYKVTNSFITDSLPSQLSFVSATNGGAVDSTGKVTWKLGTINAGSKGSVTLTVSVLAVTPPGTVIKNGATIKSDQTPPTSQGDVTNVCKGYCGDGKVTGGELCDPAIGPGMPGACPTKCDDSNPCTKDVLTGSQCMAKCTYTPITMAVNGDGCCPPGANSTTDSDCPVVCGNGILESGELCDPGIPSGPGKCPSLADCDDKDTCTKDSLTGGVCTLKCHYTKILADPKTADGCCPAGANSLTDLDCPPVCGNGILEAGEKCDTGITSGPGKCPSLADCDDNDKCTKDTLVGSGCSVTCANTKLTANTKAKDGCCPPGANSTTDSDCSVVCGNGLLEIGEFCDPGITSGPGKCPTLADCDDKDTCTKDSLSGGACTLKCQNTKLLANHLKKDGCCPVGGTSLTDLDCPPVCGNGILESGEQCDSGITSGPGKCPTLADCDDKDKCTIDTLIGSGCAAGCVNTKIQANANTKDGCCPKGHTNKTDADCLPPCGPDKTTNCVNLCKDVKCPSGHYCKNGKCVPGGKDGSTTPPTKDSGVPPKKTEAGVSVSGDSGASASHADAGSGEEALFTAEEGCACQTGGRMGSLPVLVLVGLLLVLARRRRAL